ncbi:MAG: hypothetical protein ACEPOW_07535, partial [Bacteroidales bacterium]
LSVFHNQGEEYQTAEVEIATPLISNYGKHLRFTQEMTGNAEIITEDIRLIERFFNPVKALFRNKIMD